MVLGTVPHRSSKKGSPDPLRFLASRVSSKLEEGDFRGAVCLACSEDTVAEANDTMIAALSSKHPAPHLDSILPLPPTSNEVEGALSVENGDVLRAIRSFPSGSAGGPDGLRQRTRQAHRTSATQNYRPGIYQSTAPISHRGNGSRASDGFIGRCYGICHSGAMLLPRTHAFVCSGTRTEKNPGCLCRTLST